MPGFKKIIMLIIILTCSEVISQTETLSFVASEDTYITNSQYGGDGPKGQYDDLLLQSLYDDDQFSDVLIKFSNSDLGKLPENINKIQSAYLRVYTYASIPGAYTALLVDIASQQWSESTLTWGNKGSLSYVGSTAVCQYTIIDVPELPYDSYIDIDVTNQVKYWRGSGNNYGLYLTFLNPCPFVYLHSSESSSSSMRPKLTVTYTPSPISPDGYEPEDNSPNTCWMIFNGNDQDRNIHQNSDQDWSVFKIGPFGAKNVKIWTDGNDGDTEMWLYGPNSSTTEKEYNDDGGDGSFSKITQATLSAGEYYIKVTSYHQDETIADYDLRITWENNPDPFESDDTAATAKTISNGQTQGRSIHTNGDVDWAQFTVGSGGAINLQIRTAETERGTGGDTKMWLFGPNSSTSQIAFDDDGINGIYSLITKATLDAGTYYIKVAKSGSGSIPSYSLYASWTDNPAPDIYPDAFTFIDQTDVARNTVCTSNAITVAGINAPSPISISGNSGEYQINNGSWTSAAGTVSNGNTVKVRQTSSGSYLTKTDTTLTIGGISDTFSVTTLTGPENNNIIATHSNAGYQPGGTCTVTCTVTYKTKPDSLTWQATTPAGWKYASDTTTGTTSKPQAGWTGDATPLEWIWPKATIPASPFTFTYTLNNIPANASGEKSLAVTLISWIGDTQETTPATPNPLAVRRGCHSSDFNPSGTSDGRLDGIELGRLVALYSYVSGTTRTGEYHVAAGTPDGYSAGPGSHDGASHSADFNSSHTADWKIDGIELGRVVALYSYVSGTTRTGEYHAANGTPDGFSAGPAAVRSSGDTRGAVRDASVTGTHSSTVYEASGSCTVTCTITYTTKPDSLTWQATTPAGWQYASDTTVGTTSKPQPGWTGEEMPLEWIFPKAAIPESPFSFSFTLNNIPANESGTKSITSNIVSWFGDIQENTTVTPSPLEITGTAQTATLTMAVVGNGTVTPPSGAHEVALNEPQDITATADAKWHFANWTATGGATVADANDVTTMVTLTADGTVTAYFAENTKYLVTVESGSGDGDYYAASTVNITADAAPAGQEFAGWTSADGVVFANAAAPTTSFDMPAKAVTVTANYRVTVATLTMAVVGDGTVTPTQGAHVVPLNVPQPITATADAHWHFVNWTVTGGATVGDANMANTNVTLTGNGTVTANFAEDAKYPVTVVSGSGDGDYYSGETVTITADAAPAGQEFAGWTSVDGVAFANAALATTTFVMPAKAVTVTATYRGTDATLTMAVVGHGTVTPALGSHEVSLDVPQNIMATADANWHFVNWTVTGGATVADANDANTTVTLTADGTVTAHFVEDGKYPVTVENGTGDGDYHAGATVSITAAATLAGQEFTGWTSADGVVFANAAAPTTTFVMPAQAVTVTANYRATDATLTMVVVGNGTVTPAPGAHEVPLNVPQNITADADANCHFVNWTATGGATVADPNDATTTVTLTADGTVTAHFVEDVKYPVVVVSGTGDGDYYADATVSITADAAPAGQKFAGWASDDGVGFANAAAPTTTFVMPAKAVTVTATYQPITYTITLVSRRGVLADATGWVFADGQYTRTFAGVLADAVDFPAVVPDVPADWQFAQWTVTAYSGMDAAYAPGQIVAQLPVGFTGSITLEAGYSWIGPNPTPWYPVYDLGNTEHGVHQVKVYRGNELVAGMVVRGAQVKPVDYLNAGCPGLLSGVDYVFEVSEWNSDVLCQAPEVVTPEYQLPEIGAVVAGQPDADNVVGLNIDLPMASKYLLTIKKGAVVYFPATEFVFAVANEEGMILPNAVRPMEFFTAGTYDVAVLAINPMGEAAQAATCQIVIGQPVAPREGWPAAGFTPVEGQNLLLGGDTIPVLFSWPAIVQAEAYELLVYDGNGNNVATQSDLADCHATVIMPAGVYFWRVVAIGADGRELSSPGQNFAVIADSDAPIINRAAAAAGKPNAVVLFCDPASSNYAGVSYEIQFYTAASGWIEFMGNARKAAVFTDGDLDGVYECELDLGVPVSGGYLLLRSLVNGRPLNDSFVLFRVP